MASSLDGSIFTYDSFDNNTDLVHQKKISLLGKVLQKRSDLGFSSANLTGRNVQALDADTIRINPSVADKAFNPMVKPVDVRLKSNNFGESFNSYEVDHGNENDPEVAARLQKQRDVIDNEWTHGWFNPATNQDVYDRGEKGKQVLIDKLKAVNEGKTGLEFALSGKDEFGRELGDMKLSNEDTSIIDSMNTPEMNSAYNSLYNFAKVNKDEPGVLGTAQDIGLNTALSGFSVLGGVKGLHALGSGIVNKPFQMAGEVIGGNTGEVVKQIGNTISTENAGKALNAFGFDPMRTKDILRESLSQAGLVSKALDTSKAAYQQGQQDIEAANVMPKDLAGKITTQGKIALDSVNNLLANPRYLTTEFLPDQVALFAAMGGMQKLAAGAEMLKAASLIEGGVSAAGKITPKGMQVATEYLKTPEVMSKLSNVGAVTEGALSSGMIADTAERQGKSIEEYALPAIGAGLSTALINKAQAKFGDGDVTTNIAARHGLDLKGLATTPIKEGVEEALQSPGEEIATNIINKEEDILKGTGRAAGEGFVGGAAMGGGMQGLGLAAQTPSKLSEALKAKETPNEAVDEAKTEDNISSTSKVQDNIPEGISEEYLNSIKEEHRETVKENFNTLESIVQNPESVKDITSNIEYKQNSKETLGYLDLLNHGKVNDKSLPGLEKISKTFMDEYANSIEHSDPFVKAKLGISTKELNTQATAIAQQLAYGEITSAHDFEVALSHTNQALNDSNTKGNPSKTKENVSLMENILGNLAAKSENISSPKVQSNLIAGLNTLQSIKKGNIPTVTKDTTVEEFKYILEHNLGSLGFTDKEREHIDKMLPILREQAKTDSKAKAQLRNYQLYEGTQAALNQLKSLGDVHSEVIEGTKDQRKLSANQWVESIKLLNNVNNKKAANALKDFTKWGTYHSNKAQALSKIVSLLNNINTQEVSLKQLQALSNDGGKSELGKAFEEFRALQQEGGAFSENVNGKVGQIVTPKSGKVSDAINAFNNYSNIVNIEANYLQQAVQAANEIVNPTTNTSEGVSLEDILKDSDKENNFQPKTKNKTKKKVTKHLTLLKAIKDFGGLKAEDLDIDLTEYKAGTWYKKENTRSKKKPVSFNEMVSHLNELGFNEITEDNLQEIIENTLNHLLVGTPIDSRAFTPDSLEAYLNAQAENKYNEEQMQEYMDYTNVLENAQTDLFNELESDLNNNVVTDIDTIEDNYADRSTEITDTQTSNEKLQEETKSKIGSEASTIDSKPQSEESNTNTSPEVNEKSKPNSEVIENQTKQNNSDKEVRIKSLENILSQMLGRSIEDEKGWLQRTQLLLAHIDTSILPPNEEKIINLWKERKARTLSALKELNELAPDRVERFRKIALYETQPNGSISLEEYKSIFKDEEVNEETSEEVNDWNVFTSPNQETAIIYNTDKEKFSLLPKKYVTNLFNLIAKSLIHTQPDLLNSLPNLVENSSPSITKSINDFQEFTSKFIDTWNKSLKVGFKGDYGFIFDKLDTNPSLLLVNKTTKQIDPNILTAIALSSLNWLNSAKTTAHNDSEMVRSILGIKENEEMQDRDAINKFMADKGSVRNVMANQLGKQIFSTLKLSSNKDIPIELSEKFITSLGLSALDILEKLGYVEFKAIPNGIMDSLKQGIFLNKTTPLSKKDTQDLSTVFVRIKTSQKDNKLNIADNVETLLKNTKESLPILNKLLESDFEDKKPTTEPLSQIEFNKRFKATTNAENDYEYETEETWDNSNTEYSSKDLDALFQYQQVGWVTDKDKLPALKLFDSLSEKVQKRIYTERDDEHEIQQHFKESVKGKELSWKMDKEELDEAREIGSTSKSSKVYFQSSNWKQGRVGMKRGPQPSKMMRWLFAPESWTVSINPSKDKELFLHFQLATIAALGGLIKKNTVSKGKPENINLKVQQDNFTLVEFRALFDNEDLVKLLDSINSNKIDEDLLIKVIEQAGEGFHSLAGLAALAEFKKQSEQDLEDIKDFTFTTNLGFEADGKTNGVAIGLIQLAGITNFNDPKQQNLLKASGIYNEPIAFNEWINEVEGELQKDNYEMLSDEIELNKEITKSINTYLNDPKNRPILNRYFNESAIREAKAKSEKFYIKNLINNYFYNILYPEYKTFYQQSFKKGRTEEQKVEWKAQDKIYKEQFEKENPYVLRALFTYIAKTANDKEIIDMNSLLGVNTLIGEINRNFSKYPLMITVFGSAINSVVSSIANDAIDSFYKILQDTMNTNDYSKLKELEDNLKLLNINIDFAKVNLKTFKLESNHEEIIRDNISKIYTPIIEKAINSNYQEFINNRRKINEALNLMNSLFEKALFRRIDKFISDNNRNPSKKEFKAILDELREIQPAIDTPSNNGKLKQRIQLWSKSNSSKTTKDYKVQVENTPEGKRNIKYYYQLNGKEHVTVIPNVQSLTGHAVQFVLDNLGVRGPIMSIHNADSHPIKDMMRTLYEFLGVHDAIITSLKDIKDTNILMNKSLYNTVSNFDLFDAVYNAINGAYIKANELNLLTKEDEAISSYIDEFKTFAEEKQAQKQTQILDNIKSFNNYGGIYPYFVSNPTKQESKGSSKDSTSNTPKSSTTSSTPKPKESKTSTQTNELKVEEFEGNWTRKDVESQPNKVFLFGDNTEDRLKTKHIPTSTQAVIRGLPNAIGIDTKKNRGTHTDSYFTDDDLPQFQQQVDEAIKKAKDSGLIIVLPKGGIGTGKAMLKEKAPKLFEYLQQELNKLKANSTNQEIEDIYNQLDNKTESTKEEVKSSTTQKSDNNLGSTPHTSVDPFTGKSPTAQLTSNNVSTVLEDLIQQDKDTKDITEVEDSKAHQNYLRKLINNFISKVMNPLEYYYSNEGNLTYGEIDSTFSKVAVNLANKVNKSYSGIRMSSATTYAHELIHAVTGIALTSPEHFALYRESKRLFDHVKNNLTPEQLVKYEYIFNNSTTHKQKFTNTKGIEQEYTYNYGVLEFIAYAQTEPEFMKIIESIPDMQDIRLKDMSINHAISSIINKIFDWFDKAILRKDKSTKARIDAITVALATAHMKRQPSIFEKLTIPEEWNTKIIEVENKLKGKLLEINKGINTKTSSNITKDITNTIYMVSKLSWKEINNGILRRMAKDFHLEDQNIILGLMSEVAGNTDSMNKFIKQIANRSLRRDHVINREIEIMKGVLNKYLTKELTKQESTVITKIALKGDLASTSEWYSKEELHKLLSDDSYLESQINEVSKQLSNQKYKKYFINQTRNLGSFMINNTFIRNENINAHNVDLIIHNLKLLEYNYKVDDSIRDILFKLSRLYAISFMNQEDKSTFINLHNREEYAIQLTLEGHKLYKENYLNDVLQGNKLLITDGYIKESYNPNKSLVIASMKEGRNLVKQGYFNNPLPIKRSNIDHSEEALYLWFADVKMLQAYQQTGTAFTEINDSISNLLEGYTKSESSKNIMAKLGSDAVIRRDLKEAIIRSNSSYNRNAPEDQVSLTLKYNKQGRIVGYSYLLNEKLKDEYMYDRVMNHDYVLASMNANILDQLATKPINEAMVDALIEDQKEHSRYTKLFVKIGEDALKQEHKEIWYRLPESTKQYIKDKTGLDYILVRGEVLDSVFGYRKLSITNWIKPYTKDELKNHRLLKQFGNWIFDHLGPENPIMNMRNLRKAEESQRELIKTVKDTIVIKLPKTLMFNELSNKMSLLTRNIPMNYIARESGEALKNTTLYFKTVKEIDELKHLIKLDSKFDTKNNRDELAQLETLRDMNPIHELFHEGKFQTIVEDITANEGLWNWKTKYQDKLEKFGNKLPKVIKESGKFLAMTHDTKMYKFLHDATQMSDLSARYVLHKWNKEHGIKTEDSLNDIMEAFVNYELPTHKFIDYGNEVGFLMFTKFFFRILKPMIKETINRPANVLALNLLNFFYPVENIHNIGLTDFLNKAHNPLTVGFNLIEANPFYDTFIK